MKIFLSVGHSILKNGACTSADGRSKGGALEYAYCRDLAPYVKKYLEAAGHTVKMVICPEGQFTKSTQERDYKIGIENSGAYDMVCELHLNAFNGQAHGSEVYYKTNNGKVYADRVNAKLAQHFTNRGAQKKTNLYILNQTKAPAILVECFFCDNANDYAKARSLGYDAIGKLIAEGIHGGSIGGGGTSSSGSSSSGSFLVKVTDSALNYRSGAGTEYPVKGTIRDKGTYTIVETKKAKDGGTWGRLKSGAGWINLKYTKRV